MEKEEITVKELIEGINKLMKKKNSKSQEQSDVLEKSYNDRLEKMKEPDWEEKRRKEPNWNQILINLFLFRER